MDQRPRPTLDALTSLRFAVAFRVMMYHAVRWDAQPFVLRGLMTTPLGSSYFFVASGFLLTYAYGAAFDADRLSLARFWAKRFRRILPVYYIGLVVAIPLLLSAHDLAPTKLLATLLLIQAWFPRLALYWNFPAWALSALAFFYLVLPAALRVTRRATVPALTALAVGLWLLALGLGVAYVRLSPDGLSNVDWHTRATWLNAFKYNPLVRLPEFLLGVAAGRYFVLRGGFGRFATIAFASAAVATVGALYGSALLPYPIAISGLLDPLLVVVVMSLATDGPVTRALSHPTLVRLGQSSFCLYMVHAPLLYLGSTYAPPGWRHRPAYLLSLILSITGIAVALYRWVERPLSEWRASPRAVADRAIVARA